MAKIKDLGRISKKYIDVASTAGPQYEDGVRNPRKDWAQATMAAEDSYKAGVTAAANAGRFGKGVRKAGTAKQQQGCITKGVSRYGPGVALAKGAYEQGFAPYHQVISSTQLPQRFARRDPRNLLRVAAIANALGKKKEAMGK